MSTTSPDDERDNQPGAGSAFDDYYKQFGDDPNPSLTAYKKQFGDREESPYPSLKSYKEDFEDEDLKYLEDEDDDEEENDESAALDTQPEGDLFVDVPEKKKGKKARRAFAGIGALGLLTMMAVGFLMFMTVYRSVHIRNLLWDYRFARFHYQVGKRIKVNMSSAEFLAPDSTGTLEFGKTTLGQKMRGYSPEAQIKKLSNGGLELTVEKGGVVGGSKITAYTDTTTGEKIYRQGSEAAKNAPEGSKILEPKEFASSIDTKATEVIEGAKHTKYELKNTRKLLADKVKITFGDRFKTFRERVRAKLKGESREPTDSENNQSLKESDGKNARGGEAPKTTEGMSKDASEKVAGELDAGVPEPRATDFAPPKPGAPPKTPSKVVSQLRTGASAWSDVSSAVFMVTMGCILKDVSSSINDTLRMRIEAPMRMAAGVMGEAEQLQSNDNVSLDALGARDRDFTNTNQSAAFQRINKTPESQISEASKLEVADLPFTFFGLDLHDIATAASITNSLLNAAAAQIAIPIPGAAALGFIPGVSDVTDEVVNTLCRGVLNPAVQAGIGLLDLGALIISFGGSGAATRTTAESIKLGLTTAVKIAGSVGIMKIVFEYLLPKMLFAMAGSAGIMTPGDPNNGNKLDLGTTLLASQYGKMGGGSEISLGQAQRDQVDAMARVKQQKVDEMGAFAYISPSNPYSLISQLSMSLPGDPLEIPGALITKSLGMLFSKTTINSLGSVVVPKAQAAPESVFFETYGVPQVGISDALINEDPVKNAMIVDSSPQHLADLKNKYEHCFTSSIADEALSGTFSTSDKDFSICNDNDAQRLGLYNIDNCSGIYSGYSAANCSIFAGAGDLSDRNATSGTSTGVGTVGTMPEYSTTADCAAGTQDAGIVSTTHKGSPTTFRLCSIDGIGKFNTVYSGNFLAFFNDAKNSGFDLGAGGGTFLSPEGALNRWDQRCPGRDPSLGWSSPPCTGNRAAPPGKSNHEIGLAADLTCGGAQLGGGTTGRSVFKATDPCVAWVLANSPKYGIVLQCGAKNADGSYAVDNCESWHVSPTGG